MSKGGPASGRHYPLVERPSMDIAEANRLESNGEEPAGPELVETPPGIVLLPIA